MAYAERAIGVLKMEFLIPYIYMPLSLLPSKVPPRFDIKNDTDGLDCGK